MPRTCKKTISKAGTAPYHRKIAYRIRQSNLIRELMGLGDNHGLRIIQSPAIYTQKKDAATAIVADVPLTYPSSAEYVRGMSEVMQDKFPDRKMSQVEKDAFGFGDGKVFVGGTTSALDEYRKAMEGTNTALDECEKDSEVLDESREDAEILAESLKSLRLGGTTAALGKSRKKNEMT